MSGEAEKAENPDGDIDFESENELEHSNTDQNRNSTDAGTVDEVIELPLDDDDQLPQDPDNHSDKEMTQTPKHAKTKGGVRNRTGHFRTCGGRMNCGGLHFGNCGRGNQASGGRACGTGAGRACIAGRAGIGGHGHRHTDDGLDLEWECAEPDNEENVDDSFQFTSVEGINVRVGVDSNSLDYLKLYLTGAISKLIVTETNTICQRLRSV